MSMKKIAVPTELQRMIQKRWKVKPNVIVEDGTKYHSVKDDDRVHNPIIGFTTPRELKELEIKGVVVYQKNSWRVPRVQQFLNGKMHYVTSPAFLNYRLKQNGPKNRSDEEQESLIAHAEEILGGRRID